MTRYLAALLFICSAVYAATTWYVDVDATGLADGTSWANAWTNLQSAGDGSGVQPGDTVQISGGLYTNRTDFYLENGTVGNWVTYQASREADHNDEVTLKCTVKLKSYTALYGNLVTNYEAVIGDNTYRVPMITNNCNLFIDKSDDPDTNQVALFIWSDPVVVKWIHFRGVGQTFDPGLMVVYYGGDDATDVEIAHCWWDRSTGHGNLGLQANVPEAWGTFDVHHCLFEHHWADHMQIGSSVDFHHCVIRNRGDLSTRGGCNDTFQTSGLWHHVRIFNNIIEPLDNSLIVDGPHYYWTNFALYNNIFRPTASNNLPVIDCAPYQGGIEFNTVADVQTDPIIVTNVWIFNNTSDHSLHGPEYFFGLKNIHFQLLGNEQCIVEQYGFKVMNNLIINFESPGAYNTNAAPIALYGTSDELEDPGWVYDNDGIMLDYNWFSSTGAMARCANWRDGANQYRYMLTNANDIATRMGYTHNISDSNAPLYSLTNYDYRPLNAALDVGTNLSSLTNLLPYLDTDIYGRSRGATWTIGAVQYGDYSVTNGLVLWLTFNNDDGWTTNHIITDRSGWTNNGFYFASTNHETWPTLTNGPGTLSAAHFVVNWTNPPGGFRYGTYVGITNILNGNLATFTNGTWSIWTAMDTNHVQTDTADFFLSSGLELDDWNFGKYYCDGPLFLRPTTGGGMEPWEAYVRWPNITTTNWQHYAITWDGTNWTPYLNGVVYTDTMSWTNDGNYGYATYTNQWTGTLNSTNSAEHNWIGLGVLTHSGTPDPDDVDGQPSNGQLWGNLADVRVYNRALTAEEIETIYQLSGEEEGEPAEEPVVVTNRVYVTGTVRAGQVRRP